MKRLLRAETIHQKNVREGEGENKWVATSTKSTFDPTVIMAAVKKGEKP